VALARDTPPVARVPDHVPPVIVPNLASSILVLATLHVGYVIVSRGGALSFLGVGNPTAKRRGG